MSSIKSKIVLIALAAGMHASANAGLVNPTEYVQGNKTWLHLSATAGLSIDDIEAGVGGWISKYRLASSGEVKSLLSSMGVVDVSYTASTAGYVDFIHQMGGGSGDYWNSGASGQSKGAYVNVGLTDGENNDALSPDCPAFSTCAWAYSSYEAMSETARNDTVGNFMILRANEVPEPGSLALLGLGAAMLLARRRTQA